MNIENMTLLEAKAYCVNRTDCTNCILDRAGICDECLPHSWALTEKEQEKLAEDLKAFGGGSVKRCPFAKSEKEETT